MVAYANLGMRTQESTQLVLSHDPAVKKSKTVHTYDIMEKH
jgi:hypothetical protein